MNYTELYTSLNEQQKKAVDKVEGTVMVVAGPGTGKTQVLGARVASILAKTDCYPENILCLTFTDAATVALRNRLYDFIESDAQRVHIYTYHAFCNMIIQDHVAEFGFQELNPAADLDVLEVIKEIIDELPNEHLLKRFRGAVYYDVGNLKKLFNLMKKDRLTHAEISAKADDYLEALQEDPNYRLSRDSKNGKKGDLKQTYFGEKDKMDKLKAASKLIEAYTAKMVNRKLYDYNDMINWVIDKFQDDEFFLRQYQESYQYILVDEYQDTNGAQNRLLELLIDYWEDPNVFVVGDDDQSIYKFQGANVENILEFHSKYKNNAQLVVLTENYRSTPSILHCSNQLIKHNQERLVGRIDGLNKEISSSNQEVIAHDSAVKIHIYENVYQEIVAVADSILQLQRSGVKLSDIAVIYRNHSQSQDLIKYLQSKEVPFEVAQSQNILEEMIVIQLMKVLQFLDLEERKMEQGQHLLFEMLHFRQFKHLRPIEISKLSIAIYRDRSRGWRSKLYSICSSSTPPDYLSKESFAELQKFVEDLEYWSKERFNVSLQNLVEQVMAKGGFISRALSSDQNIYELQCLKSFFNFIKDETASDPLLDISGLLKRIDLLQENDLGIELNKVIYGSKGVKLLTAHSSKGLEFNHVFIIGCTADKWEKNSQKLAFNLDRILEGEPLKAHEEEGRRLFYVAMTRARLTLNISYSQNNEKSKPLNKSVFVDEVERIQGAEVHRNELDDEDILGFFVNTLDVRSKVYSKLTQMDFVDRELEQFRMSATNLNSYLKCPVAFFYQNIVRVPSAKNEYMTFGTAVHKALELFFNKMLESPDKVYPPVEYLTNSFSRELSQHKESFTEEGFKLKNQYGKMILAKYAEHKEQEWALEKDVETEVSIKNVEFEGIPIRGQLDKLVKHKGDYYVTDYKTGQYSNARSKIKPPETTLKEGESDHNKIYGGDYWRQIMFYHILLRADRAHSGQMKMGVLEFIEPVNESFKKENIMVDKEQIRMVETQIRESYQMIMNKEFNNGCSKDDCEWCNFNKFYLKQSLYSSDNLLSLESDEMEER